MSKQPPKAFRPDDLDAAVGDPEHVPFEGDIAADTKAAATQAWRMFTEVMVCRITETVENDGEKDIDMLERRIKVDASIAMTLCFAAVAAGCESLGKAQSRMDFDKIMRRS